MNYIERYVYAVKKHLPADQKDDIGNEIRALILEQVSEDDAFEKIEAVLKDLGSPRKLAYSYRNKNRSLIGPEYFELYLDVLKIALMIVVGINVVLGVLGALSSLFMDDLTAIEVVFTIIGEVFGGVISSALIAFSLVTLGFVAAIHFKWIDPHDEWMLKELPELPKKDSQEGFSCRKAWFETLGVTIGMSALLVILRLPWLAFSDGNSDLTIITPANYDSFFPTFLGLMGVYLFNQLLYIKHQGLTQTVIVLRSLHTLAVVGVLVWMFFGATTFLTPEDLQTIADALNTTVSRVERQVNLILTVFLLSIFVYMVIDRINDIRKLKKRSSV